MTTITDDIGVWNDLGTLDPVIYEWTKFPVTAVGGNATIRASFFCSEWNKINNWCLLRAKYTTAQTAQVSPAIRVYPSQIPRILEFPIPQDLMDRNIFFRDFEVIRKTRYIRYIGRLPGANWQIKLEELWG